jgi:hypothetical protein
MSRTLFAIGLLLLVVAVGGGFWRLKSDIPMSGTSTPLQDHVQQATLISPALPTVTPAAQMIMIETPAPGTLVGSPVVITGRITEYPAQGQLHYRIVDDHDDVLGSGDFTVTGTAHHTGTFNASLIFTMPAVPSRITLELFDRDPSIHATVTSAALSLNVDPSPVLPPQGDAALPLPLPEAAPPLPIATPMISPIPTATHIALITETASAPVAPPTPAPTVIIAAEYPGKMDLGASGSISMSLRRILADVATATSVDPGRPTVAGSPATVGTPAAPLGQAFGPGYDAVVIARVVAPAFEVQSTGDERSLDQEEITWQWGITPKFSGHQVVIISVDGQWRPQAGGRMIERHLWRREFYIDVDEPILSRGQISLASLATGLAGSVLSIPWLVEQVRMWQQQRQGATPAKQRVRQRDA